MSVNTIDRLLHVAQQTPAATTLEKVARSMGVTAAWLDPDDAGRELSATETAEVRRCAGILRTVARGTRIDARTIPNVQPETARRVPGSFRVHGARQVYRVLGPSLVHAGLLDGDLAYVRPAGNIRHAAGAFVVARLNGSLYLKRLMIVEDGAIALHSAADGYEPIVLRRADTFALLGEVVATVRECWRR